MKATAFGSLAGSFLAAGHAQAAMEVANLAAADNRGGVIAALVRAFAAAAARLTHAGGVPAKRSLGGGRAAGVYCWRAGVPSYSVGHSPRLPLLTCLGACPLLSGGLPLVGVG